MQSPTVGGSVGRGGGFSLAVARSSANVSDSLIAVVDDACMGYAQ